MNSVAFFVFILLLCGDWPEMASERKRLTAAFAGVRL
jgi:hypothetical protein